jgi:hypothetical protein
MLLIKKHLLLLVTALWCASACAMAPTLALQEDSLYAQLLAPERPWRVVAHANEISFDVLSPERPAEMDIQEAYEEVDAPALVINDEPLLPTVEKICVPETTNERRYLCTWPDCTKAFRSSSDLKRHGCTHTHEKTFFCTWPGCGKSFNQKGNFERHMRFHTGTEKKPYQCNYPNCQKDFAQKSFLEAHLRTHNKERKFVCTYPNCNRAFIYAKNLKIHHDGHLGKNVFPCKHPHCGKTFTRKDGLNNHMKQHTKAQEGCS